ncbi:sulfate adenylyltransferase subunit CysD [Polymorphobacter fuscus]|uniref:Sulfate adenylyltransferase subunit 2 n=1 Tax=Sandarakinorhabdus fusca TaxID=1439888 RepID=A0A7C9LFA6_9SPHN|nr:sulfate adenylyltransferase subunit CysD [Polymorphobacter fuscus]KAB7648973.1 sulfate adenylyltransferase subunit CysD [Polymorphobacter fuscus]MQT16567.1 sulfate adenylyltransferase subunit CysD [Polymorphobacter fuscus]NJC07142.1 sulfate adenylyltransferase subunit 2 [Polymorphobacter fuscus]
MTLTHLQRLEAESIHILREVVAEVERPVMLYSIGKDSSVMLHLALKAFYPAPLPFPLLHIASGWDFQAMLAHRDTMVATHGLDLIVQHNDEAAAAGINPFDTPTPLYTRLMLTDMLKAALDAGRYDAAFGGGRRDEEKARAKERIFSFRNPDHVWDPRNQRPEVWNLYNSHKAKGDSIRVFPLSNWTELDIWQYIEAENIPIVPLYLAAERPTVTRDGMILMVDDDRMALRPGETVTHRAIRFRTLGCYPLSGAAESSAASLPQVIQEMLVSTASERLGRAVDHDPTASMEKKKAEGYF